MTTEVVPSFGTKSKERDNISLVLICDNVWSADKEGTVQFEIPWLYRRENNTPEKFATITMKGKNHGGSNSKFSITKGNLTVENNLNDASSCTSGTCN
jgi:hypothetical protein